MAPCYGGLSSGDDDEPTPVDPYELLGIERTATPEQVKSAYRKAALKNHPDKVPADQKGAATEKFQDIARAYAVLSDPARRKCYNRTGSMSECTVDSDDFNWSDFYREQFRDVISEETIRKFAEQYKGSGEETADLLEAYERFRGDMDKVYEHVMLSNPLEDDERFRAAIGSAVARGDVPEFSKFAKESKKKREARVEAARKEADEADELAKELGVYDALRGGGASGVGDGKKKSKSAQDSEANLAALILKNKASRTSQFDKLAEKYGAKPAKAKGKKRGRVEADEVDDPNGPTEEEFQKLQADMMKRAKKRRAG